MFNEASVPPEEQENGENRNGIIFLNYIFKG